ncbi:hypothetical protein MNV49_004684 [Pseudohyphozyma bogoriensis]|nr:hypothetical protein MNV49_004684 [Pseudohyphozyma bogoriensis]
MSQPAPGQTIRPSRSSSLNRGTRQQLQRDANLSSSGNTLPPDYPPLPLRDPYSESAPLAINSSPHLPQLGTTGGRDTSAYGDQPYSASSDQWTTSHHGFGAGSLDLSDVYGGTVPLPTTPGGGIALQPMTTGSSDAHHPHADERGRTRFESVSSRTPINTAPNSSGTPAGTQPPTRSGTPTGRVKYAEKSGYHSRGHSRERSQGAGLGNWTGPGGGRSPYGVLGGPNGGQGNGSGQNSANTSNPNLLFAEGDMPINANTNAFTRMVSRLFEASFLVRWIIYIIPFLILLWIPGILGVTAYPNATIWGCPLVWWSAWFSVVWCGWWGAALVARVGPTLLKNTLGVVAPELRHYILYVQAVQFYTGAAGWALAIWISFSPMIRQRVRNDNSKSTLSLITQGLFGLFIVLVILLLEKVVIQVIAHNFHKKSYEDRIIEQKFQIRVLVSLYVNSHDVGRSDTLDGQYLAARPGNKRQTTDPTLLVKKALRGAKKAAQTATTVIGTVASEIAGERVLQPNSPASMVTSALGSANKTKQLARRIFYSFCPSYRQALLLEDVSRCFENRDVADRAFAIFDRDGNGDASLEEIEMACLDVHRERLALSNSMRDIDSAVGRLDGILMGLWWVISALIIAGMMDTSFQTMVASAGTVILGLSWLIGTTSQEILASIIFLFIKHVYDVGDRVDIDGEHYVVKEMHLLSTIFRRTDGTIVQAPHSVLNTKFVQKYVALRFVEVEGTGLLELFGRSIRRSGAILETFTWDVAFDTSFEKIEELRLRMLEFLEVERRDFFPTIDIQVQDFAGQSKLSLSANICYKSNWQNGALKAQRRNKWTCALKLAMASLSIFGPAGAGDPSPAPADPTEYTLIPWEEVSAKKEAAAAAAKQEKEDEKPSAKEVLRSGEEIRLASRQAAIDDDAAEEVFAGGESALDEKEGLRKRM